MEGGVQLHPFGTDLHVSGGQNFICMCRVLLYCSLRKFFIPEHELTVDSDYVFDLLI